MSEEINRVEIEICGEEYVLKGNESIEYMKKLAHYVNKMMKDISNRNFKLPLNKVAILTALNIADEYYKIRKEYERLSHEHQSLIEELTDPEPVKADKKSTKK